MLWSLCHVICTAISAAEDCCKYTKHVLPLGTEWTRHHRAKETTTQRTTLEGSDKTKLTFETYFYLIRILYDKHKFQLGKILYNSCCSLLPFAKCSDIFETSLHPQIASGKCFSMLPGNRFFSQSAVFQPCPAWWCTNFSYPWCFAGALR